MQLDLEFLAGFKPETPGVGVADQQIAVAVNSCAELGLAASCSTGMTGALRQSPALSIGLRFHQCTAETFLQNTSTGTDVAASQRDLFLWPIAQRSGLVEQFFADQHLKH